MLDRKAIKVCELCRIKYETGFKDYYIQGYNVCLPCFNFNNNPRWSILLMFTIESYTASTNPWDSFLVELYHFQGILGFYLLSFHPLCGSILILYLKINLPFRIRLGFYYLKFSFAFLFFTLLLFFSQDDFLLGHEFFFRS